MSPLRLGQHACIHLGDRLRLALVGQRAEDVFRPRFGEGWRLFQQYAILRFLDGQPGPDAPLAPLPQGARQDDLTLAGDGGGELFRGGRRPDPSRCKTNVR